MLSLRHFLINCQWSYYKLKDRKKATFKAILNPIRTEISTSYNINRRPPMGDSYPEVLKIWSAWWKKLLNRERQLLKSSISESSAWLSLCHRLIGITRDVSTSPASSMNKDLCLVIWTKQIKEHSVCYRWKINNQNVVKIRLL